MRIKSYFTKNIAEAMNRARIELGPDAVIIASNKTTGNAERLGKYEVVFGIPGTVAAPAPVIAPVAAPPPVPPASEGLERLRARMEDLRKSVSKKREQVSAARMPLPARVAALLTKAGFPAHLAEEMGSAIHARAREEKQDLIGAMRSEVTSRIRVAPKLRSSDGSRTTVAIVGPPGVGKTTTLVKIALTYGLAAGRPTRLVTTDTYRLGGPNLLRGYADAMGVSFSASANLEILERTIESDERNGLTIIDTPGLSPATSETSMLLANFLAKRADIDVHLVLPAYASYGELSNMAA